MTVYNMGKALAKSWGVVYGSEAYYKKFKDMRENNKMHPQNVVLQPCGPICETCGDNSYYCGHKYGKT